VTSRDPEGRRTIFDSLPAGMPRVVTVAGSISCRGPAAAHQRRRPGTAARAAANGWIRRYRARVHGTVDAARLAALANGITIEGVRYGAIQAKLDRQQRSNACWRSRSQKARIARCGACCPSRPAGDAPDQDRLRAVSSGRTGARAGSTRSRRRRSTTCWRQAAAAQEGLGQASLQGAPAEERRPDAQDRGRQASRRALMAPEGGATRPTASPRSRGAVQHSDAREVARGRHLASPRSARTRRLRRHRRARLEALSRGAAHVTFSTTTPARSA